MRRDWLLVCVLGALGTACGSGATPTDTSARSAVASGRDCALATSTCASGHCSVEIDNHCATPVTCRLHVESLCKNDDGQSGPANAATQQMTQLAGTKKVLEGEATCGQGTPVATKVEALECI